jgi:hypothetical protein
LHFHLSFTVLHLSSIERLLYSCVNRSKEGWVSMCCFCCCLVNVTWRRLCVCCEQDLHGREMDHVLKSLSVFLGPRNEDKIRCAVVAAFVMLTIDLTVMCAVVRQGPGAGSPHHLRYPHHFLLLQGDTHNTLPRLSTC